MTKKLPEISIENLATCSTILKPDDPFLFQAFSCKKNQLLFQELSLDGSDMLVTMGKKLIVLDLKYVSKLHDFLGIYLEKYPNKGGTI